MRIQQPSKKSHTWACTQLLHLISYTSSLPKVRGTPWSRPDLIPTVFPHILNGDQGRMMLPRPKILSSLSFRLDYRASTLEAYIWVRSPWLCQNILAESYNAFGKNLFSFLEQGRYFLKNPPVFQLILPFSTENMFSMNAIRALLGGTLSP